MYDYKTDAEQREWDLEHPNTRVALWGEGERDQSITRHLKKKKLEVVKMTRGTEVRHTQTGVILMIKKDYGSIVTCYSKRYSEISPGKLTNVELYRKDYLIPTEN